MRLAPERRPFRFGVVLDSRTATRDGVTELARRAEAAGVTILLGTDHLGRWATLPLLQSAAEATGLRIGTLVLNNDLRHPAVLAQELTTIDAITGGRSRSASAPAGTARSTRLLASPSRGRARGSGGCGPRSEC